MCTRDRPGLRGEDDAEVGFHLTVMVVGLCDHLLTVLQHSVRNQIGFEMSHFTLEKQEKKGGR